MTIRNVASFNLILFASKHSNMNFSMNFMSLQNTNLTLPYTGLWRTIADLRHYLLLNVGGRFQSEAWWLWESPRENHITCLKRRCEAKNAGNVCLMSVQRDVHLLTVTRVPSLSLIWCIRIITFHFNDSSDPPIPPSASYCIICPVLCKGVKFDKCPPGLAIT